MKISKSQIGFCVMLASTMVMNACAHNSANDTQSAQSSTLSAAPDAVISMPSKKLISELSSQAAIQMAFKTIEADRALNVENLILLNEIPAPPFGEEARALRVGEMFRDLGLTDVEIDEVGNVVARRSGRTGQRTIGISAHLDTVFPIETDVTVRKEGDTFIAPGIGDNTRGLVVILSVLKAMQDHNIKTEDDVLFIGNVGEEGLGDLRGVKHLYKKDAPNIDALIVIDGGSINRLIYGGVGSNRYRVTVKGPGGHSWGAFGDANPHHALGRIVNLFSKRAPDVTSSGPKTSFNVGRIGGGTSINSIPFESWMEVDMRSGDVDKLEEVDRILQKSIKDGLQAENDARLSGPELTVDIKEVGRRPAGRADENSPLVQHAMAAMKHLGIEPNLRISSTDANIPISLGKPAITLSRGGISKGAHSFKETWTDKDSHLAIQLALLVTLAQSGYVAP